ncbi:hypothetical protein L211DRAFT_851888 [Terfezia boudieri ATCC MYA-4762]|uniref:Uncharacterized protein n=1 Tax=Terfezia boudieri ATCC MYA-4762 TaxID=1051890 RepID=A0A3N4LDN8_9PEZI|nr:hypothetical protein L211DRAFT_851888 [Terfezia boudieri ATCC MYA-4762]
MCRAHIKEIRKEQGLQQSALMELVNVQKKPESTITNLLLQQETMMNVMAAGMGALQSSIIDQEFYDLLQSRNYNDSVSLRLRIRPETTPGILLPVKRVSQAGGRLTQVVAMYGGVCL